MNAVPAYVGLRCEVNENGVPYNAVVVDQSTIPQYNYFNTIGINHIILYSYRSKMTFVARLNSVRASLSGRVVVKL